MIVVKERPYDYCMSGNPVAYELYSALAASNADIYFEVKVKFCYTNNLVFTTLITFPVYPTAGTAKFDIKDFLDGKLEHNIPAFDVDEKLATEAPDQVGLFYIECREILTVGSDPSWNDSESEYQKVVIKGGLNYFKYRGDNFWRNYFNDNNPFLTWQKSGRLARKQDRMYLAFLNVNVLPSWNIPEVVYPTLWSSAKAYYTDGTESDRQYNRYPAAYQNSINFIPAGCDQWSLQDLNPAKTIWKWDIQMWYTSASDGTKTALNEPYVFEADNRNNYNNFLLQFRNSLGGIDPILLRGVIEPNQNYTFDEQQRTFLNNYFSGDYISPARVIANSKERTIWKADAGYLPKEDQDRLRDMNLNRNAWWDFNSDLKWWPVIILSPSFKQRTSEDTLWQFPIEFALAADADKYYTPEAVDIGDQVFASNVCEGEISAILIEVDTTGPTGIATITFTTTLGITQYTYKVPGIHTEEQTAEIGDLPLVITGLDLEESFVIQLRTICANGVKGRRFTSGFNTIGDGGGGGGGAGTSSIFNNTTTGVTAVIEVDAISIYDNYLPEGSTDNYTIADTVSAEIVVDFTDPITMLGFTPTLATLTTDSGTVYFGLIHPGRAVFHGVDIVGGMAIEFS